MAVRGSWNRYYGTACCPARLPGPLLRRYVDPYVVLELTRLWNHGRTKTYLEAEDVFQLWLSDAPTRDGLGRRVGDLQARHVPAFGFGAPGASLAKKIKAAVCRAAPRQGYGPAPCKPEKTFPLSRVIGVRASRVAARPPAS